MLAESTATVEHAMTVAAIDVPRYGVIQLKKPVHLLPGKYWITYDGMSDPVFSRVIDGEWKQQPE